MELKINGKLIIISLLVLVGLFWFFSRGCNGGNDAAVAAEKGKADSAIKAIAISNARSAELDKDNKRLREDSIQAAINQEALAEESNKSYAIAGDAQDATKVYQKKYEDARKQVNDLLALSACDSLNVAITNERTKGNKALKACKDELNGCGDIVVNRNKTIYNLNQQVKALQQPANIVSDALHAVKAATKEPWVKGYIGAEGDMGVTFGGGPSVAFEFRNGLLLTGAVKLMGGTTVYEAGVHKLISFKKR